MPKTRMGKWSVRLIIGFFLLFTLFNLLVASGQRGGATFLSNPALSIPIILAGTSGTLAFITGIASIIRNKERSFLVFASTIIGLFITLFWLGEIVFPH